MDPHIPIVCCLSLSRLLFEFNYFYDDKSLENVKTFKQASKQDWLFISWFVNYWLVVDYSSFQSPLWMGPINHYNLLIRKKKNKREELSKTR